MPNFDSIQAVFRLHLLYVVFKLCALKVKGFENFLAFAFCLKLRVNGGYVKIFNSLHNCMGKVCSINFEPPDNDLCSVCHVYPLSRGAWMISILFILNRFTWGRST